MANTSTYVNGSIKKTNGTDVEYRFPKTALNNIVVSPTSATTFIVSNGKIKPAYLTSANATAAGVVYNNDSDHLTITNGGLSINTYTSNLSGATVASDLKKIPVVSAVKNYISTYTHTSNNIPQSAVNGLEEAGPVTSAINENGAVATVGGGAGIEVTSSLAENNYGVAVYHTTVSLADYTTADTNTTGATVTIAPGSFYQIDATTSSKTLAITAFDANKWGRDSYLELFVANTGYIHTANNVTLVDALEPDSVNNCRVRFHNGHAIISVDDHVGAYMVNNTSATTSGSLSYGLMLTNTDARLNYIGFRSEFNSSVIPTNGATVSVVQRVVGNGADVGPTISGSIRVVSSAFLRNIKVSDLTLTSGTLTLGNVNVVSGSTVGATATTAVLKLDHVTGDGKIFVNSAAVINGAKIDCYVQAVSGFPTVTASFGFSGSGTLNLNGNKFTVSGANARINVSGMTITSGGYSTTNGGVALIQASASGTFSNCVFSGNRSPNYGGVIYLLKTSATFDNCIFSANSATIGPGLYIMSGNLIAKDCAFLHARGTYNQNIELNAGSLTIIGDFRTTGLIKQASTAKGTVVISSGAVLDFTNNSNTNVISPNSKSIIVDGGCIVIDSGGVERSIAGGTYTVITNGGEAS